MLVNPLIDRIEELGFNKSYTFAVAQQLVNHKRIWIVNDVSNKYSFVEVDVKLDKLQEATLWPK